MISPRLRQVVKHSLSQFVEWSASTSHASRIAAACLCYHSVSRIASAASILPEILRNQLSFLKEQNYKFAAIGNLASVLASTPPKARVIVITFDDGFEDNYTEALPILAEYGIPATFFVCTGLVLRETEVMQRFQDWTGVPSRYLSAAQISGLHRAGMEIGAHTHTHRNLALLSRAAAKQELTRSKEILEDILQTRVRQFAYPYGKRGVHYTQEIVDLVRESEYESAACIAFRTLRVGRSHSNFEIPRFFVEGNESLDSLRRKVDGCFDWLGSFQESSPAWLKRRISPEDNYM